MRPVQSFHHHAVLVELQLAGMPAMAAATAAPSSLPPTVGGSVTRLGSIARSGLSRDGCLRGHAFAFAQWPIVPHDLHVDVRAGQP